MNLRDLEYIVAIDEWGSMARAAEKCNVSQSTLSIQLKKLEDTLDIPLFERNNKRLTVTEAGAAIINVARGIMQESARIKDIAREYRDPFAGEFRLGIFPTLAPYLLPRSVPRISKTYPKLVPLLIEEKSPVLLEKLQTGELDAALLALPAAGPGLESAYLFEDPFLLACHKTHPLAKQPAITMNDLQNQTLLLLEDGHCLRDQALEVCYMTHAKEYQEFRATSLETLRQMVAANVGLTLMPKLACIPTPGVSYVPFVPKDKPARRIGLVWRASTPRRKLIAALTLLLRV